MPRGRRETRPDPAQLTLELAERREALACQLELEWYSYHLPAAPRIVPESSPERARLEAS